MSWQRPVLWIFIVLAMFSVCPDAARSQKSLSKKNKMSPGNALLVRQWDRNGDGYLQSAEIPIASRGKIKKLAKSQGLDLAKPLRVDSLIAAGAKSPKVAPPKNAKEASSSKSTALEEKTPAAEEAKPAEVKTSSLVAGFGVADVRPAVPGFGVAASFDAKSFNRAGSRGQVANKKGPSINQGIRRLAKSLLAQNDKNKNGQLEKNEWASLRGNPKQSDRNRDGILTLDELTLHLAAYSTRDRAKKRANSKRRSKSSYRRRGSNDRKSYRFLSSKQRLPEELPGWFSTRDADGDGQLTMQEHTGSSSAEKLRQFAKFDLNGDGFIVPREYLLATKPASK